MSKDFSKYPAGSIMAEMVIDIYAAKSDGEITILHDRPFGKPLKGMEYTPSIRELYFIFDDDSRKPYGKPIKQTLAPYLEKEQEIAFFQMDIETKKPLDTFTVPLQIVTY